MNNEFTRQDKKRAANQRKLVKHYVLSNGWVTLQEIAEATGQPEASVSARLRDLRAEGLQVDRRRVKDGNGLHIYRVTKPSTGQQELL